MRLCVLKGHFVSSGHICDRKMPGPSGARWRSRNLGVVLLPGNYWSSRAYIGFPFACSPDPYISVLERSVYAASIDVLDKLAQALGVTHLDLLQPERKSSSEI